MPQFGKNKMCKKWVKLTGLIWTVLYLLLFNNYIINYHKNGKKKRKKSTALCKDGLATKKEE